MQLISCLLPLAWLGQSLATAMDDYVWAADPNYGYVDTGLRMHGRNKDGDRTWDGYVLNMTSQQWLTPEDVSRSIWWHTLVVIVPSEIDYDRNATLWITGGSNENPIPDSYSEDMIMAASLAMGCKVITGALFQVPNEHIVFSSDPIQKSRSEDAIIAFTWDHFLKDTSDPEWLVRFPMVKASLRAMDTVTDYVKNGLQLPYQLDYYSVAGASKRGWTTWLVGAVDPDRVMAIVPIVLDAINFVAVEHHQWRSYNGWSFALSDYYDMGIMTRLDTPEMVLLQEEEDPYFYRHRLTMPKLVVNAVGDEFQQPDDTWYWWNDLPEPKHFLLVPNAEHSLATGIFEALPAVGTWLSHLLKEKRVPDLTWSRSSTNGDLLVHTDEEKEIHSVRVWNSTTWHTTRRDFRLANIDDPCECGIAVDGTCINLRVWWQQDLLHPIAPHTYKASVDANADLTDGHWRAFLVDVIYESDGEGYTWPYDLPGRLEFSTEVSVWPNTFLYEDCYLDSCAGELL